MASRTEVGLFVTCLVDILRPRVGFATARLLEQAGFSVAVPQQSCCGQPNFNAGDKQGARTIARAQMAAFAGFAHVVAPSGSCASMVKTHYASLFDPGTEDHRRAVDLAERTHEITSFLADIAKVDLPRTLFAARATYHDACSGLRELGIKRQPRALLKSVERLTLVEMREAEACCGFGGTFCVKYPELSTRIVDDKLANIAATNADCVVTGEVGCLLNMEGRLHREGRTTKVLHVAEVLAGMTGDES
jgi:L-lactate dehydrogenase complex protein LldE